jgi:hypothetical protein
MPPARDQAETDGIQTTGVSQMLFIMAIGLTAIALVTILIAQVQS